jgi:hypothetical protein
MFMAQALAPRLVAGTDQIRLAAVLHRYSRPQAAGRASLQAAFLKQARAAAVALGSALALALGSAQEPAGPWESPTAY